MTADQKPATPATPAPPAGGEPPWWHSDPEDGDDTIHWIDNATQELDHLTTALAAERADRAEIYNERHLFLQQSVALKAERDEARAEVGRLKTAAQRRDGHPDWSSYEQVVRERDEARAESEGLQAALRTCADLLKRTQDAHAWSDHLARQIAIAIAEAHAALTPPPPPP